MTHQQSQRLSRSSSRSTGPTRTAVSPRSAGKVRRIVYGASSCMRLSPMTYRAGNCQYLQQAGQIEEQKESGAFCGDALAITKRAVGISLHYLEGFAYSGKRQSLYASITVALHANPALPGGL